MKDRKFTRRGALKKRGFGRVGCILLLSAAFLFSACQAKESKKYEFNVGTSQGESSTIYKGLVKMKEAVEKRTEGNLTVNVFPSSQLGSEEDIIEQAKLGANVGTITDNGRLSQYVKELGVVGVAYVADSYEEMVQITSSKQYKEWIKKLYDHNLELLSMNWFQGSRNFYTNKEIKTPEDLKGVLIRTPAPPVWEESVKAIGATPVGMPWTETYPAMQQKVIDGFEVQTTAAYAASLQETIKYITKTGHFQLMSGIVASHKYLSELPAEYKKILVEEAVKAGVYESKLELSEAGKDEKEFVEKYGIIINDVDLTPFKKAARKAVEVLGYGKEFEALQASKNSKK